ncbi:hypothetical protein KCU61_g714, partial [Aureobasidium melanogenum]
MSAPSSSSPVKVFRLWSVVLNVIPENSQRKEDESTLSVFHYVLILHIIVFFIDHVTSLDEENQSPQRSYSSRQMPLTKPMAVLAKVTESPTALSTVAISVSLRDMIGNIRRPRTELFQFRSTDTKLCIEQSSLGSVVELAISDSLDGSVNVQALIKVLEHVGEFVCADKVGSTRSVQPASHGSVIRRCSVMTSRGDVATVGLKDHQPVSLPVAASDLGSTRPRYHGMVDEQLTCGCCKREARRRWPGVFSDEAGVLGTNDEYQSLSIMTENDDGRDSPGQSPSSS